MAAKKEDEIMAEYLLKGGKMLEKTCNQCGCPMFEYKKKTFCVVCAERGQEQDTGNASLAGTPPRSQSGPTGTGAAQGTSGSPVPCDATTLADELVATIRDLCARIRTEEDPDRCLCLMDAVKVGIEALAQLRQV